MLLLTYKESYKSVYNQIQYGPDHPVEEVIQNVSRVLVKHLNLNKTEIIENGLLIINHKLISLSDIILNIILIYNIYII